MDEEHYNAYFEVSKLLNRVERHFRNKDFEEFDRLLEQARDKKEEVSE